jgi:hypothetical protein
LTASCISIFTALSAIESFGFFGLSGVRRTRPNRWLAPNQTYAPQQGLARATYLPPIVPFTVILDEGVRKYS